MTVNKNINNYFLFLFSIIPLTIVLGPTVSLVNIILIDISFLILIIYNRNFDFIKDKSIFYLLLLYLYLIFNSFISIDFYEGFYRNFGFIRIIILFAAFNFFFVQSDFYRKVFKFWSLIIFVVIIDVLIESFFGRNIFGFSGYQGRIVSFFKDEPIVGGFLFGFYLLIIGFLMSEYKENQLMIFFLMILFMLVIFITGERSNSIKSLLALCLFLLFINSINIKKKILILLAISTLMLVSIFNPFAKKEFLKHRYGIVKLTNIDNVYFKAYSYGFEIFKNYKLFGVGNKNYRLEACKLENIKKYNNLCNTHPHQIYFELLSEHGIIGSLIIIFIMFKLVFSKITSTLNSSKYLKLGSLIYIMLVFLPLLPGGAFFSNYLLTIFAINLSIFYALDKKLNIFRNKD
tara:strand:+ start:389 stop:1597 length:1209 start_codon:yes stop_codon:yes gene_type:complete